MKNAPPKNVDAYLAELPKEQRTALEAVRAAIRAAVPDAVELLSYQIPTFKHRGRPLIAFGAAKGHCSLYVMSEPIINALQRELAKYDTEGTKTTIRFAANKPISAALVKKLVKARIGEIEAQAAARKLKETKEHGRTK